VSAKSRGAAFVLNFFFPGLGFAYLGRPSLIIGGIILFACSMVDSISDFQRAFELTPRLLLGLATALSLGVIAGDFAQVFNHISFRKCPYCAEEIKTEAHVCKHCGRELAVVTNASQ
jgi:hypothetical protein